jgi:hypothetical protein
MDCGDLDALKPLLGSHEAIRCGSRILGSSIMRDAESDPTIREMEEQELQARGSTERALEIYRIMFHKELGVASALHYCAEHGVTAPPWLVQAASEILFVLLRNDKTKKRGRSAGIVARYRQDMIDFERWDLVRQVREKQDELPLVVDDLRKRDAPQAMIDEHVKMRDWVGRDWLRAYECASMILQGTDAHAGPDAMKSSYLTVKQNNDERGLRYHVLGAQIEYRLDINCNFQRRVNKGTPFYDLTL